MRSTLASALTLLALAAGLMLAAPASAMSTQASESAQSSPAAVPAGWMKYCRKAVKQGIVKKCLTYEVTYGAVCKKSERNCMARCYVDVYGTYEGCWCLNGSMDGKWRWNAPE